MAANDTTIDLKPADLDGADEVAVYETPEQARAAVKLLVNTGYTAEQIFVLCSSETNREKFRSEMKPAGAVQLDTAPCVVGGAGAAIGGAIAGGVGLTAGPATGVAGAAFGAVVGAGIGAMLGLGTCGGAEARELQEQYRGVLDDGKIVVLVRPRDDASNGKPTTGEAKLLLAEAQNPQG